MNEELRPSWQTLLRSVVLTAATWTLADAAQLHAPGDEVPRPARRAAPGPGSLPWPSLPMLAPRDPEERPDPAARRAGGAAQGLAEDAWRAVRRAGADGRLPRDARRGHRPRPPLCVAPKHGPPARA